MVCGRWASYRLPQVVFIRGGRSVPPSIKPLDSGGRWQSDAGRRCERICRGSSHFRFVETAYAIRRTSRISSRIDRWSLNCPVFHYEPIMILNRRWNFRGDSKFVSLLFFSFFKSFDVSIFKYDGIRWYKYSWYSLNEKKHCRYIL